VLALDRNIDGVSWVAVLDLGSGDLDDLVRGDHPAWAPDGERLVFTNRGRLRVLDLATGVVQRFPVVALAPSWSPDGRSIVFEGADQSLHVVDVMTATVRDLTDSPTIDAHPTWSPDGRWVAFGRDTGTTAGGERLFVVRVVDGLERRIARGGDPSWIR
jgi:TolB protein